jgi:hypothetical protein
MFFPHWCFESQASGVGIKPAVVIHHASCERPPAVAVRAEVMRTSPVSPRRCGQPAIRWSLYRAAGVIQFAGLRMEAPSSFPGPDSCTNATSRKFFGSSPGLSFS